MAPQQPSASIDKIITDQTAQELAHNRRAKELEIEREWLELARVDCEAFAFFYRKYRQRIFGQILLMTRDLDVAADLTAETFVVAIVMLDTFCWQNRSFGSWLARIAQNQAKMNSRHRKVQHEVNFDPRLHDAPSGARPDHEVERMVEKQILSTCLGHLRAGQRQAIEYHYFKGQTIRETALALGVAESTVKSRLQDGRRQLRARLVECGVNWGGGGLTGNGFRTSVLEDG